MFPAQPVIFPVPNLESAIFPRSLISFRGKWLLEAITWALLPILFLFLGFLSRQSQKILFFFFKIRYTEFILVLPIQNQDSSEIKLTALFSHLYLSDPVAKKTLAFPHLQHNQLLFLTKHEKESKSNNPSSTIAQLCIGKLTLSLIHEFLLVSASEVCLFLDITTERVLTEITVKLFKNTKNKLLSSPRKDFKNPIHI